ncbi:urease accessory protein UreF [Marivibrio halodurans]|uniref:Urease accessory protein UreF n=2 Tax=Marivibrio halodurans TaxID=2039722 RepID=A0A8J7V4Z6_9PROT|nr:urease accessory protein UreF [Marivibrio halodurans]
MATGMGTGTAMDDAALYKVSVWLSPAFPVGGYTYSHGLEWAIEAGEVRDAESLRDWLETCLAHGAGRSDAILLAAAWRAACADDRAALATVEELAAALSPSRERALETHQQGQAFARTAAAVWPEAALDGATLRYPVAVGWTAGRHQVPLRATLICFLQAFAANIVSAGVRAIPLGQTDGQRVTAALAECAVAIAGEAETAPLDEIGGAALRIDLASLHHETQYSRLFRS